MRETVDDQLLGRLAVKRIYGCPIPGGLEG